MPAKKKTTRTGPSLPPAAEPTNPPAAKARYTVIRDTREKEGQGWHFAPSTSCQGTVRRKLDTGDYTIEGMESLFTVDRKGSIAEFAGNIYQGRFARELERMASFKLAIVLLEFDYEDIVNWPQSSDIPRARWKYLKVTRALFQKRLWELQIAHPHVHFIFAGLHGKEAMSSLLKRAAQSYAN